MINEEIKTGDLVFVEDEFLLKYDLKFNKITGDRPFMFVSEITNNKNIYWLVPITSKYDKYKEVSKIHPDKIKLSILRGKNVALLYENMFPITKEHITGIYKIKETNKNLHFNTPEERKIISGAISFRKTLNAIPENAKIAKSYTDEKTILTNLKKELQLGMIKNKIDDFPINKIEDIKTWTNILTKKDDEIGQFQNKDFKRSEAIKAWKTGRVKVYSDKEIINGNYVFTSKEELMKKVNNDEAKLFSKEINLDSAIWLNGDKGVFADIDQIEEKDLITKNPIDTKELKSSLNSVIKDEVNNIQDEANKKQESREAFKKREQELKDEVLGFDLREEELKDWRKETKNNKLYGRDILAEGKLNNGQDYKLLQTSEFQNQFSLLLTKTDKKNSLNQDIYYLGLVDSQSKKLRHSILTSSISGGFLNQYEKEIKANLKELFKQRETEKIKEEQKEQSKDKSKGR